MLSARVELFAVLLSGLAGSVHCLGMCGSIAASMSLGAVGIRGALIRQLFWGTGRIVTYVFLGLCAAAAGTKLLRLQQDAIWLQSGLAILAGVLLIVQALRAAGWMRGAVIRGGTGICPARTIFSRFFLGGSHAGAFVAGVMTGFLPCGLVYGFLALAASTGHPGAGALLMFCFGLGTLPMLLIAGAGFSFAAVGIRRKLLRVAAISVLVTGLITVSRGVQLAASAIGERGPSCPLCSSLGEEEGAVDQVVEQSAAGSLFGGQLLGI
jgi:sulfite exporter TauE/SafE